MCEVGMRVVVNGTDTGMVIGHLGREWAIISLDAGGGTVIVPEGAAKPRPGTKPSAVVVQPDGTASALSRRDSQRVRVRPSR